MNKIGINLWNWEPSLGDSCLGLPEKIRGMGFTAIELPMTTPDVSDALAGEIREAGLEVSLCAANGPGRDISNFDPDIRKNTLSLYEEILRTGEKLHASVFAGPLYTGGGKRHVLSEEDRKREWDLAVKGLRRTAKTAAQCGIRLALEPLNRYRTSVCNTVGQILQMVEDVNEPCVGLHFDTYQSALEERDLLEALERSLKSGRVYHFHACANNRSCPGEGLIPWDDVMDLLVRYGYDGHITMETFAPGGFDASFAAGIFPEADEMAAKGLEYLKGYFERREHV